MRQKLTYLIIALGLAGCEATPQADPTPPPDVRVALATLYPVTGATSNGGLQFEQDTPIESIDLPAVTKALPNVQFFTTKLSTGSFEYPLVSVAVGVPDRGPIAVFLSPTYDESDPAFTTMLLSARVSGDSDELAFANEIAHLLALITHGGEIREPRYTSGRFSADLWHGDLRWRRLSIEFVNGQVSSVSLVNPKDRTNE